MLPIDFMLPGVRGDETKLELLNIISRLSSYNQLARDAGRSSSEIELLDVTAMYTQRILNVPRASIALLREDGVTFSIVAIGIAESGEEKALPASEPIQLAGTAIELAIKEQRTIHTLEFSNKTFRDWRMLNQSTGLDDFIISPLTAAGSVYGTLNVGAPKKRQLGALDIFISRQFASILASNLRAHRNTVALERASKAKTQFLAHMSHEIRTPMNAILGFAQLLNQEQELLPQQKKKVSSIMKAGEHLLTLINQVLEMSRIESGSVELVEAPFILEELVDSLDDILRQRAASKGIELRVDKVGELPTKIIGDILKIRQILINLIGNAIRLTQRGSVTLQIERAEGVRPVLEFRVIDTGPGISEENLQRIFGEFQQVRDAPGNRGTGLGLTISQRYANAMDGEIRVSSVVGEGSTFTLAMPLLVSDAPDELGPKRQRGTNVATLVEFNLAAHIVDDDPINLDMLEELLTMLGVDVTRSESGAEALQYLSNHRPDIVIIDHRMPGMHGTEVLTRMKSDPSTKGIPVIMASASVLGNLEREALQKGASAFIRKPIEMKTLVNEVVHSLGLEIQHAEPTPPVEPKILVNDVKLPSPTTPIDPVLLQELEDSALICDISSFSETIRQLESSQLDFARNLLDLAENFQWDRIVELLASAKSYGSS